MQELDTGLFPEKKYVQVAAQHDDYLKSHRQSTTMKLNPLYKRIQSF